MIIPAPNQVNAESSVNFTTVPWQSLEVIFSYPTMICIFLNIFGYFSWQVNLKTSLIKANPVAKPLPVVITMSLDNFSILSVFKISAGFVQNQDSVWGKYCSSKS